MVESFTFDHTKIKHIPYVRLSKTIKVNDTDCLFKFDVRLKKPNGGNYLTPEIMHTFEHIFSIELEYHIAHILGGKYFDLSPMGCQTGFYFSFICNVKDTLESLSPVYVVESYVASIFNVVTKKVLHSEYSEIPFATEKQCGNYKSFDLDGTLKLVSEVDGKFKPFSKLSKMGKG